MQPAGFRKTDTPCLQPVEEVEEDDFLAFLRQRNDLMRLPHSTHLYALSASCSLREFCACSRCQAVPVGQQADSAATCLEASSSLGLMLESRVWVSAHSTAECL